MNMEEILQFTANNAFAIVVCVYMLVVNNKSIAENTEATNKMCMLVEQLVSMLRVEKGIKDE